VYSGRGALRSSVDRPVWELPLQAASETRTPLLRLRPLQGSTQRGLPNVRLPSLTPQTGPPEDEPDEEPRPRGRGWQLSWSSAPLRRTGPSESTPPRLANTGYVPPSGFLTLSAVSSSLGRPALFHAGDAHGVSPFRDFPSPPGPEHSSCRDCLLDVPPPHHLSASMNVS
jgi:hypothetical protein